MTAHNTTLPLVVLAGRPNVGKSTLFNRLVRKRRVITDPTPGVTRDPVESLVFIAGKQVRLVDSGGFKLDKNKSNSRQKLMEQESFLDNIVVERTLQKIETADLIVLMFAAGEVSAEDEEFIQTLRPVQNKIIAVVNKTEGGRRGAEAWNLLSFGFETLIMISAEHGDNISQLEEAIASHPAIVEFYKNAPAASYNTDLENTVRIALIGKPNTGKSTLSNRLTASDNSIVSDIPGTTRDVLEGSFKWKDKIFVVADTAGIRRKAKVRENIEYYSVNRAIGVMDEVDIIILLIDAQEGLSDQDKKIAALACDKGRGVILALNKWDLMPDVKNAFNAAADRIRYFFGKMEWAPIIALSAKDGAGVAELLNTSVKMKEQLDTKIDTSAFNAALEQWQEESPPPSGPQTRFKIKYGVQISQNPVKFRIFVSRIQAMTTSYTSYICNKIRADLGFSKIPILLEVRSSTAPKKRSKK
ncbi:GTPase Der [Spirochaetia bacterium]|nr:GTPase Der [Spirochaetia bacterium]